MEDGDFIRIDYIGKILENGEIFDLTKEDVAKERGIYNENFSYHPVPVIIGSHFIIRGLEDELRKLKIGEKKKIVAKPEDAFGGRSEKLMRLISLAEFKKQNIDPFPGMIITLNNLNGKVVSISGGRVKVDFNHPLAGKKLEYEVEVKEKIEKIEDKVKAILELFISRFDKEKVMVITEGESVEIRIQNDVPRQVKESVVETIKKWIESIKKVRFVEEF